MNAGIEERIERVQQSASLTTAIEIHSRLTGDHGRFLAAHAGLQCCAICREPDAILEDRVRVFHSADHRTEALAGGRPHGIDDLLGGACVLDVLQAVVDRLQVALDTLPNFLRSFTHSPRHGATIELELLIQLAQVWIATSAAILESSNGAERLRVFDVLAESLGQTRSISRKVQRRRLEIAEDVWHEEVRVRRGE